MSSWLRLPFDRIDLSRIGERRCLAGSALLLLIVAVADYLSGYELLFSIFYLVPVGLVTWVVGLRAGVLVSAVAVGVSLAGDLASGVEYSSSFVPFWNVLISISFYLAMVVALTQLRGTQQELEARVLQRTAALREEIRERERLESMLLEVSEREQRRIGHDLHDSLCQHLTGTALAAQVLTGRLEEKSLPEAAQADRVVTMIEDGIQLSRSLARGLSPAEMDVQGLTSALRELASTTAQQTAIACRLELPQIVLLNDSQATTQLYRIAQEAVRNAVKHSGAQHIVVSLTQESRGILMTVEDDGAGLPEDASAGEGMGLHIMRHRAELIGAQFELERLARGTRVRVRTSDMPGAEA